MNNPDQVKIAATNLYKSKKCYMLLLGSGVSRAAGIKTVYELDGDLIKTAYPESVSHSAGPHDWYKTKFLKEPDYSSLIETVNNQPGNRKDWLKSYFEDKKPTKAHQAIAQLVKQGYIKIILTTNFDRLMEKALETAGIAPNVIVNEADADSLGNIHSVNCVLIKLNGDYCSLDMKNTSAELQSYNASITKIVTEQLAVSGLIISGWSAECDTGLVEILNEGFKNERMYESYWGSINETYSANAEKLCKMGGITKITNHTADDLFTKLLDELKTIDSENKIVTNFDAALSDAISSLEDKKSTRMKQILNSQIQSALSDLSKIEYKDLKIPSEYVNKIFDVCKNMHITALCFAYCSDQAETDAYTREWCWSLQNFYKDLRKSGHSVFPASILLISLCMGLILSAKPLSLIEKLINTKLSFELICPVTNVITQAESGPAWQLLDLDKTIASHFNSNRIQLRKAFNVFKDLCTNPADFKDVSLSNAALKLAIEKVLFRLCLSVFSHNNNSYCPYYSSLLIEKDNIPDFADSINLTSDVEKINIGDFEIELGAHQVDYRVSSCLG